MQYGLIGRKLTHSFSKEIHSLLASYQYDLCEIEPQSLSEFFKKKDFKAINVTIPYKNEVIPYIDCVSDKALALGSVNTIVNKNGILYGYNTDYMGMKEMILRSGVSLEGKKVLVLGTGATSRTSSLVAKDLGAKEILLVSRKEKDICITYKQAITEHNDAQVIINATPTGMYPDSYNSPICLHNFDNLEAVFDAVYNPLRTSLVIDAKEKDRYGEAGLYMLVSQAVHAVKLFTSKEIPQDKTEEIYKKTLKQKENIVLIGMPSCGKTTVGRILSKKIGRELIDLDNEIEKYIGCTIAEFFKTHTEKDFRAIETEITKEISKKNGIIISTGGGCVLKYENVRALRSNGRLYFLDRDPKNLMPTDSRPLARKQSDIEKLYFERYTIYSTVCDTHIDGNLEPNEVANLIGEEFFS